MTGPESTPFAITPKSITSAIAAIANLGASSGPAVRERLEAALRAEPDAALKALASERLRAASASHDNKSSD